MQQQMAFRISEVIKELEDHKEKFGDLLVIVEQEIPEALTEKSFCLYASRLYDKMFQHEIGVTPTDTFILALG